jgi:hypothetical protein
MVHETGPAMWNIAVARGRTKPVTCTGRASLVSAASTRAGRDATDELELKAMS